jgi:prolipoprotein diacylglyceryltransferase
MKVSFGGFIVSLYGLFLFITAIIIIYLIIKRIRNRDNEGFEKRDN